MKVLSVIILCCLAHTALAQDAMRGAVKKGSLHWYVKLAGDYHFNENDTGPSVDNEPESGGFRRQEDLLTAKDAIGSRIGIGLQRITRYRMFFLLRSDVKFLRHSLLLNYKAAENGYPGSSYTLQERYNFTEYALNLHLAMGYSLLVAHGKGAVDFAMGANLHIPVVGESNKGELIHGQTNNNSPYQDAIMYVQTGWGDQKPHGNTDGAYIPINVLADFQVAYTFNQPAVFSDRKLRIGLDLGVAGEGNYLNTVEVTTIRANRETGNKYKFKDLHLSLGFFVAVEI